MDLNQINFWLSVNAEKFAPESLPVIKRKLEQMDDTQMMYLQSASFQKPSTILIIAILLGWERFWLHDIALGVVKIITGYGCGIWWLIDIFSAKKRTFKYNFKQFQKATAFAGGAYIPNVPDSSSNNENASTFKQNATGITSNPIVSKVKNILLSPKTEWEAIDKENSPHTKVLTNYLLKVAAIPAVVSFLGYIFYGIFGSLPFGYAFGMGFKVAIMMYLTVVGGVYLTALVATLLAENFGSVKDFNKSFSLAAYGWTPLCVAGVLLIYPVPFLFWLWVIVGILYGIILIYNGIRPLLKTPLEQLTPYVAICVGGFTAAFFLLIIVLSYIFLGGIYFSVLSGLSFMGNISRYYRL